MSLLLSTVESILYADSRLQVIHDSGYELSFQSKAGLQLGVNRQSTVSAVCIWIQNTFSLHSLALSPTAKIKHYPAAKTRAHLSASRLAGPYSGKVGNDCWYIALKQESDFCVILDAYLK